VKPADWFCSVFYGFGVDEDVGRNARRTSIWSWTKLGCSAQPAPVPVDINNADLDLLKRAGHRHTIGNEDWKRASSE